MRNKTALFCLLCFFLGLIFGTVSLILIALLPLSFDHPINNLLGIQRPQVVGFLPFWLLEQANKDYTSYITTFTYFGLTLNGDGRILKIISPQEEDPGWTRLRSDNFIKRLKEAERDKLKYSLLIHSSNEVSIAALLKNPEYHAQNLITNISPIMKQYGFTDLNLDIESFREASSSDQMRLTLFMEKIKKSLEINHLGTLTVEITPISLFKSRLVDPAKIGKIADYVVLMGYDFHVVNSLVSGPVAPFGGEGRVRELDVETSLNEALKVIPADKIVLGVPLYGYEWETVSHIPGAATIPGGGSLASHRRVSKILERCNRCSFGIEKEGQQPYVIFKNEKENFYHQIFYEDKESLKKKLELAKRKKIVGVALWALGYEGEELLEPLKKYKQSFVMVQ